MCLVIKKRGNIKIIQERMKPPVHCYCPVLDIGLGYYLDSEVRQNIHNFPYRGSQICLC